MDDERISAGTLALVLKSSGHTVQIAYSGEDAVQILPVFLPQAIISDVMMPGMSGIDLADYASQILPDCKTLLFTGRTDLVGTTRYAILPKPIHPSMILRFVESCAAGSTDRAKA